MSKHNITVRTDGIINNTLTEDEFLTIAKQIFGVEKKLGEYIAMYNSSAISIKAGIAVHIEVPDES